MKKNILILSLFLLLLPCVSANIIILNETQKDHYALELIKLSGDLKENKLFVQGYGEVIAGNDVKVYLFGPSSDFLISEVYVNNQRSPVSFDDQGYYFIAQKGSFQLTADLNIRTIGQIRLYVPGPLNEVLFDIKNGYTVDHNSYGLFKDTIIIQRTQKVAKNVEGEFHYIFDAHKDNFRYTLHLRSFGSDLGRYTLPLRNGEFVEDVTGALRWEQSGNNLILDLEGDTAKVSIAGTFRNTNLRVPLEEGNHHVLIESDPEKKITLSTGAREIDISESPIYPRFSNARAFIAGYNQPINVIVKDLDLLPSLSASIRSAQQTLAITSNGGVVGNVKYRYSNTGVDYLPLDIPGTPLYASTSRGPVKLTKDEDFMLAFPKQNNGLIEVIFYETLASLKLISLIDLPLVGVDLPITKQDISIIIPKEYYVLNIFGIKGGSELPSTKSILVFLLLISIAAFFLFRDYRYTFYSIFFLSALFYFDIRLFFIAMGCMSILIIRRYTQGLKIRWKVPLVIIGVIFASLIVLSGVFLLLVGAFSSFGASNDAFSSRSMMAHESVEYDYDYMESEALSKVGSDSAQISVPLRQGVLPVRLELPQLGKKITVTDHLITKEKPSKVKVLMVSTWLSYIFYVIGIFFGYLCIRRIQSDWKTIWKG